MGEHDSEFVKQQYERASDETTHPKSRMGAPEDLSPTTQNPEDVCMFGRMPCCVSRFLIDRQSKSGRLVHGTRTARDKHLVGPSRRLIPIRWI